MSRHSITTNFFPSSYETGNWLLFNIYTHDNTRFHEGMRTDLDTLYNQDFEENEERKREIEGEPTPIRIGELAKRGFQAGSRHLREVGSTQIEHTIGLYLPENIKFSYGVNWGAEEMGLVRSFAGAISHIGSGVGNFIDSPGWESFKGILDRTAETAGGRDVAGIAVRMAAGMASLAGIPLDRLFERHQKNIINKHTELHFNGVNLRTFEFNFKFYPKNVEEAKQIKAITDTFKFHMHPELSNQITGLYMMYPSQFEISFMRGWGENTSSINQNVAKVGRVALTDCKISHGEGEYVPIRGPAWSRNNPTDFYNSYTEMSLQFQELKVLTKEDIVKGY